MWSKGEMKSVLEAKALLRKGTNDKAEEAALLYARAQGWTEEDNVDPTAAEKDLDALLDDMDPEDWEQMQKAASHIGDATFKGLVLYAVKRIGERNADNLAAMNKPPSPTRDRDRS